MSSIQVGVRPHETSHEYSQADEIFSTRIRLGGSTASFPALKRTSQTIDVRLADDSGAANLRAGFLEADSSSYIGWSSSTTLFAPSNGVLRLSNAAGTDFSRLQFGGTTSSFPSLKRSGTTIQLRLADDTAGGAFTAETITANSHLQSLGAVEAGTNGTFVWTSKSKISCPTNNNILIQNNGGTDFGLLQLGGTTSSFPAIKRSSTSIQVRLADDSGYGSFETLYTRVGSGSPEGSVTAPVGAVYHRTDGGAGTSFYVKESGAGNTGWVAK